MTYHTLVLIWLNEYRMHTPGVSVSDRQRLFCQRSATDDTTEMLDRHDGRQGVWRSKIFPGLWLDHTALAAKDRIGMLDVVHQGLRCDEHKAFVRRWTTSQSRGVDHGCSSVPAHRERW